MKAAIPLMILAMLTGSCLGPDTVDVSRLTAHDRLLFAEAAAHEGVRVTTHGRPWHWTVRRTVLPARHGQADPKRILGETVACDIEIDVELAECVPGGQDQHFISVARHELRHCQGHGHLPPPPASDWRLLMVPHAPCWPVD